MSRPDDQPNPDAPPELARFAFLIGTWRCEARVKLPLAGTWLDLGPSDLGGVTIDEHSVSYVFKEPVADHTFTRAIYTNIADTHFTWRGEKSDDGQTWNEFMVVEADRVFRTSAPSRS
jgi:hypothetical protein